MWILSAGVPEVTLTLLPAESLRTIAIGINSGIAFIY
jgi:hypothetical protein